MVFWIGWLVFPFMLVWATLLILIVIFWIWMLVDCLTRKKFEDKLVWVLVLIFLNILGAILYFFLVKTKKSKRYE